MLSLPALPVAMFAGALLGLHADGLVPATLLGPIAYRLAVAWMVRGMSSQPPRERPARPLWRLDVLDLLFIYPAAAAAGVRSSGRLFGTGFPSSIARFACAAGLALLLGLGLEAVAVVSSRSRRLVRICAGLVTSMAVASLFLGAER